jgi:thioredoxin-related protein
MKNMSNVDIDIYISQIISFFEKNPNELFILIGDLDRDFFFKMIKEVAQENHDKGEDINLTRSQMIDIVVKMHKEIKEQRVVNVVFMETPYGDICLN